MDLPRKCTLIIHDHDAVPRDGGSDGHSARVALLSGWTSPVDGGRLVWCLPPGERVVLVGGSALIASQGVLGVRRVS